MPTLDESAMDIASTRRAARNLKSLFNMQPKLKLAAGGCDAGHASSTECVTVCARIIFYQQLFFSLPIGLSSVAIASSVQPLLGHLSFELPCRWRYVFVLPTAPSSQRQFLHELAVTFFADLRESTKVNWEFPRQKQGVFRAYLFAGGSKPPLLKL